MGKSATQLPISQLQQNHHGSSFFGQCSMGFYGIRRLFSYKCVFVLLLSVAVFLSAIFSVVHFHRRQSGYDAKASVKQYATVQARFRLQKPVSFLLPQVSRLEYDINAEVGVPYAQVAILSMHQSGASNWTNVVFGVLSDPMDSPINAVSLSVLRSSFVELFTQSSNLTLTTSIFGQPSSFEILKFPGGITVVPKQSSSIWILPQVLFNFTLPNSLCEIEENFAELKQQLNSGLHLKSYESVYVVVTNKAGSTRDPPVIVQASIVSNFGSLMPERLKQLAETITGSPRNLGLDHSVFGKVKEISLSSYLSHSLDAPTPSPAPSPDVKDHVKPPTSSPYILPPSQPPRLPPCANCDVSTPSPDKPNQHLPPISNSPVPSVNPPCHDSNTSPVPSPVPYPGPSFSDFPPRSSTTPPPMYPSPELPPDLPPIPAVSYGSHPNKEKGTAPPPLAALPLMSSSISCSCNRLTWSLLVFTLMTLCLIER